MQKVLEDNVFILQHLEKTDHNKMLGSRRCTFHVLNNLALLYIIAVFNSHALRYCH